MSIPRGALDGNWDDWRVVLALHRHGSISGAARLLGVSEVTVARRLRHVEGALGARLFERDRGQVSATQEASVLVRRLVVLGDELDAIVDALGGSDAGAKGLVHVTGVSTLINRVLARALPALLARHPELEIELVVDTSMLGITYGRETDIAVRLQRPVTEPDAIARKIGDLACGIYCHRDLVAPGLVPPWITYAPRSASLPHASWIEEQRAIDPGRVAVRVDDAETLLQCVRAGLGKSLLADVVAAQFSELVRLDDGASVPAREMWILMHPSLREVRRIEIVARWASDTLGGLLGR